MKRAYLMLTLAMVLLLAVSAWGESAKPPKLEKPKEGFGRYVLVLWEPGTPVPGDEKKHMPKMAEPDYGELGGTLLITNANWRVVDLPVKEAGKLRKHRAVASMQRLWMGEPYAELEEPPEETNERGQFETESDTNLTWGPKTYQYDGSGNIKAVGSDSFVYDTAGRLIQSTVEGKTETFQYDAFGNLIQKAVDGANPVEIPVDGASNRMIGAGYDAAGNVTQRDGEEAYTYDEMDMLSSTKVGYQGRRQMVYDADDERIGVLIDSSLSRWWIRDLEGKVLREFQGQNQVLWYWEQDWVYGEGELVGAERVKFQSSDLGFFFGGKRHYHLDHLGSVRMVTDDSGRSVSEHDYYAFGVTPTKAYQEQINWGDPHIDAMRFTGHQREFLGFINTENTEYLDYMHARFYDPNLGRFLSVDPGNDVDLAQPQSWNKYSYVRNNPVNYTDPSGMVIARYEDVTWVFATAIVFSPMGWFFNGMSPAHLLDRFGRGPSASGPTKVSTPTKPAAQPCPFVPPSPPGVSLAANIAVAQQHQAININEYQWFKSQVGPKRPWDYKRMDLAKYERFGNFNYGATGAAMGIPSQVLLRAAGYYQPAKAQEGYYGAFFGSPPYGDDPADQVWISQGIEYYQNNCSGH